MAHRFVGDAGAHLDGVLATASRRGVTQKTGGALFRGVGRGKVNYDAGAGVTCAGRVGNGGREERVELKTKKAGKPNGTAWRHGRLHLSVKVTHFCS